MNEEIQALTKNNTWGIVPLLKKPIGCKWVFKLKLKEDGTINKYKARLVAKGYKKIEGINFTESFSPVTKTITVLAVTAAFDWEIHQLDINNDFLHGYLEEDI
ncbi:UNVERIFIED_CONTAM: Retrovirus-related Pol polyprotein from transposon TNT 1-94 [Sesamum calycinum]|uniref:Retrovirus-related Pol polyprotein from transposon TNT 1-94 n=1 Tax=Sesamum calycinum TaxID=2727403 RepID=A0AAW2NSN8_9LAMI